MDSFFSFLVFLACWGVLRAAAKAVMEETELLVGATTLKGALDAVAYLDDDVGSTKELAQVSAKRNQTRNFIVPNRYVKQQ